MYKNNKIWLFLGLLTVLVLVLAGCAKEETPASDRSTTTSGDGSTSSSR